MSSSLARYEKDKRVQFAPTPVGSLLYSARPVIGELGSIVTAGRRWLTVSWDKSGELLVRVLDVVPIDDERAA